MTVFRILLAYLVLLSGILSLCVQCKANENAGMKLQPFQLSQVRLADGPFKVAQESNHNYLNLLDADRLLHNFRINAGLQSTAEPLGGAENPKIDIRGHFTGHYLSACALMYASTGDEDLKKKSAYIVSELGKCQVALGGEYLSAFPDSFFDRFEKNESMWATYYVMHKLMAGLYDQYELCGNQQALDILKKMASYFQKRISKMPDSTWQNLIASHEHGGFGEVMYNLYSVTGNQDHLWLAKKFGQDTFINPLAFEQDNLSNIHANTHIPIIASIARGYELMGNAKYEKATKYFWNRVVNERSYATGGSCNTEWWPEPNSLPESLSPYNQEFCTTYNMLKVTRHLICWTGDVKYADYYERALINSVLSSVNSADGMVTYNTPLTIGCSKQFGTPYNSFWCCSGTCAEALSKLGDSIYFHDGDSIYVNLFISSKLNWKEKKICLAQQTDLSDMQHIKFTISADSPTYFGLKIRLPYWATNGFTFAINGKKQKISAKPSSYISIERKWKNDDMLELSIPLSLHIEPMKKDPNIAAVMYGPIVLAGSVSKDHFLKSKTSDIVSISPVGSPLDDWYLLTDGKKPETWLKPVKGQPLVFETYGINRHITFKPLFNFKDGETYGVYWLLLRKDSIRYAKLLKDGDLSIYREKTRVIDRVIPGDVNSESAHHMTGYAVSHIGYQSGRAWREGNVAWGWELNVLPDAPMTLVCTYFSGDNYSRHFEIIVEDKKIAEVIVPIKPPCKFVEAEYPIPFEITRGKIKIKVEFRPVKNCIAGSIYGLAILKPQGYQVDTESEKKSKINNESQPLSNQVADQNIKPDVCRNPKEGVISGADVND